MTQKSNSNSRLILIAKLAVIVGAFTYLISTNQLNFSQLKGVFGHPIELALGILLSFMPMVICFVRYKYLLRAVGINLPFSYTVRIGFIGCFFNTFMLGGMGGDVVKIAYIIKDTGKKAATIAATMIDRVIGLLGMISIAGLAMLMSFTDIIDNVGLHMLVIGVLGVIATVFFSTITALSALIKGRKAGYIVWGVILILSFTLIYFLLRGFDFIPIQHVLGSVDPEVLLRGRMVVAIAIALIISLLSVIIIPSCQDGRSLHNFVVRLPLGKFFMNFISNFLMFKDDLGAIIMAYVLSFVLQLLNFFSFYFFSKCVLLQFYPQLTDLFFAAPLAFVANTLPIPGGGLGVGEMAFNKLLELCSTPEGASITGGAAIFLLWRFWNYIFGIVIGLPLYLRGRKEIIEAEDEYISNE